MSTVYNIDTDSLEHVSTFQSQGLYLENDTSFSTTSSIAQNTIKVHDVYFSNTIRTYYTYSTSYSYIYKVPKSRSTAYFKAYLNQDPLKKNTVYSTGTLIDLYSRIGGLGSLVLAISALFMTSASSFLQTKGLLEELYNEEME